MLEKPKFNTVIFLLFFLFFACEIFIALVEKWINFEQGGILLFLFVVLPHVISFLISVRQENYTGAIVIFTFLAFWSFFTYGLFRMEYSEIVRVLKVIEFPIFVVVFLCAFFFYRKAKPLFLILLALGTTVLYLWISKFTHALDFHFIPGLSEGKSHVVAFLGVGCLWVAIVQHFKEVAKREKYAAAQTG